MHPPVLCRTTKAACATTKCHTYCIHIRQNQPTNKPKHTNTFYTHSVLVWKIQNPNIFSFGTINWIDQQYGRLPLLRPQNNGTAHRLKRHTTHIKCHAVTEYKFTHTLDTLLFIWYSRYKTHKNRRTHKHWTGKRKPTKLTNVWTYRTYIFHMKTY